MYAYIIACAVAVAVGQESGGSDGFVDTSCPQFRGPRGDGVGYGANLPYRQPSRVITFDT